MEHPVEGKYQALMTNGTPNHNEATAEIYVHYGGKTGTLITESGDHHLLEVNGLTVEITPYGVSGTLEDGKILWSTGSLYEKKAKLHICDTHHGKWYTIVFLDI